MTHKVLDLVYLIFVCKKQIHQGIKTSDQNTS